MSPFEDFNPCPALDEWLLPRWQGRSVGGWVCPSQRRWSPPRALRRLLAKAGVERVDDAAPPGSLDVLVVVSPLPGPQAPSESDALVDEVRWRALRVGGLLVDLATAERRAAAEVLRPWVYGQRLRDAAAQRVRQWLERGAFGPEQWVAVAPADVVVTMVERAVEYGG